MAFSAFTVSKQQVMPFAALLALVAVTVLTLLSLLVQQPAIETDLLQRTRQALAESGLPTHLVHFNGRDGVLTGTIAGETEGQRLAQIVSSVYGVRHVENRLIPVSTASAQVDNVEVPPLPMPGFYTPPKRYPIEKIDLSAIQFKYSRAELNNNAVAALEQVLVELRQQPAMIIEVSAHTDHEGTALGNLTVSQARAEVIRNYLLSQGIEAKQVRAKGYGSTRPIVEQSTAESTRNRRIDITVLEQ
ncbi:OmpA family protein [Thiothrix subterranea]|uniref:OmpA family protein n=1 Tax=Thiothrix subterranea TaxID=2735563 RepID=A0AA51MST6_9GAMM|nr:OmpA family protein [Thiothrix subterranea]MDQ5768269.1 OmpA family protein [Thiothrix subterranea]WML87797.1 OmpA family protein [Thiothrix subterranea]